MTELAKEKIVIVGGGFAGLNLAKKLNKKKFEITLIDRNNFHSFPPLFYQIASCGLDTGNISFPFRREVRKMDDVRYEMGNVEKVDPVAKTVTTQFNTIKYDKLIIAAGTTNNYFGIQSLKEKVFTLKSVNQALRLKSEILERLERASLCKDPDRRKELLSFVVIGAGPTGVEIAGAIGEMKRYILKREYPELSRNDITVTLIEGTNRVLRTMSEKSSEKAYDYLRHLMVDVQLERTMTKYENNVVELSDGRNIYSEVVIWTAGITAEPVEGFSKETFGPGNRFIVDEFNKVKDYEDVYAIGDISFLTSPKFQRGYPQLAQVAIQQSANLAKNLNKGAFTSKFEYNDKGSMATIGRNRAVCDLNKIHLYGLPAWMIWMFIHLISILGMRNKLSTLINWVWAYFTYSTSLRLVLRPSKYPERDHWDFTDI